MNKSNSKIDSFKGSMLLGAIGDAWGSAYENIEPEDEKTYQLYPQKLSKKTWRFTDDTILTLATCEAILEDKTLHPKTFIKYALKYYKQQKIVGVGASTLKALEELSFGGHWSQVGRQGEYAAGNGAAMRIAPLAFFNHISNERIKEICNITHRNDEAYVGALSVVLAIKAILNNIWSEDISLMRIISNQIPDTKLRDRLLELDKNENASIEEIAKYGTDGYVVNSVPFAIFCAQKIKEQSLETVFKDIISCGGDTDTNCSITGQIMGTYLGVNNIPNILIDNIKNLNTFSKLNETIEILSQTIT